MAAWGGRKQKGKAEEWDIHKRFQKALEYLLHFGRPCTCVRLYACAGCVG